MEIHNTKKDPRVVSAKNTVTDIRPSVHDENRANIFIDGEFSFSLDISQIIDLGVKVGKTYSSTELESLRSASEFGKLYTATLAWLMARPRSIRETRDHLKCLQIKRKSDNALRAREAAYKLSHPEDNPYKNPDNLDSNGRLKFRNTPWARSSQLRPEITDENIARVIDTLIEKSHLDDARFAKFYVENRFVKKGISRRRLELELEKKGVSRDIIASVLDTGSRDEMSEIQKIIAKKSPKYPPKKLKYYLLRQGFSRDLVESALSALEDDP